MQSFCFEYNCTQYRIKDERALITLSLKTCTENTKDIGMIQSMAILGKDNF